MPLALAGVCSAGCTALHPHAVRRPSAVGVRVAGQGPVFSEGQLPPLSRLQPG